MGAVHREHAKHDGRRLYCTRKSVESIGTHERNEVTETQGFSLVFTARPHISFTIWLIGFFPSTRFGMSSRRSLREGTGALGDPYHLPVGTRGHASANAEMNGRFVLTSRVSPPESREVMVRSGGLVFSAKLRRFSGWALIYGPVRLRCQIHRRNGGWMTLWRRKWGWTLTQLRLNRER